jgi:hypothetical protein
MPSNQKCAPGCACKKHGRATYAGRPVRTPEERRTARLEGARQYRVANRDKLNAQSRAREQTDARRETKRRYRDANREKIRADSREYQRTHRSFRRHGLRPEQVAAMWEEQRGRCIYCERPLPRDGKVVVDHDHTCCPPMTSCATCRRGLAHNNCNVIVGMAGEDWDLLRAIAANGAPLAGQVRERIAGAPTQEELPINVSPIRRETG